MEAATTGLSQGDFTLLRVLDATGNLTNILSIISGGGVGGGGGIVTGVTVPLNINGGVLSLDQSGLVSTTTLASYSTTVATNTALSNALAAYTDTTNIGLLLAGKIATSHEANNIGIANVI